MLDLIQELVEARLYRGTSTLEGKTAEEIAKISFLMIMMLEILRFEDSKLVSKYVADTLQYEQFDSMRSSASDLHNLLAVLNNQDKYKERIKVNHNISVPVLQLRRYLRDISANSKDRSLDRTFFTKLENFFKITDSNFKQIRRYVGDWHLVSDNEKNKIRKQIKNFLQNYGQQNDLLIDFKKTINS